MSRAKRFFPDQGMTRPEWKTCSRCKRHLPAPGNFYTSEYQKDGWQCWCNACQANHGRHPSEQPTVLPYIVAPAPEATTAQRVVEVRTHQAPFRDGQLGYWGSRCAVTGLAIPELLTASHIKPWRHADHGERIDRYNGLLLNPTLDKLFDQGWLTFDDDGVAVVSRRLGADAYNRLGLPPTIALRHIAPEHRPYLAYHRQHVFRGNA